MPSNTERRKLSRLPLAVLLQILVAETSETFFGETRNVSAQGIYFRSPVRPKVGQDVECVLVLPENLTQAEQPILVGCKGTVVRVDQDTPGESAGIAIEVNSYDFSGTSAFTAVRETT